MTPQHRDPLIIGLTGLAGSGKDTAAKHLVDRYGFVRVAFAEAIDDMLAQLLEHMGADYALLHEREHKEQSHPTLMGCSPRQLKQTLGDWGRALHPEWWIRVLQQRLGLPPEPATRTPVHDRIVISDVRYLNEAKWIVEAEAGRLVHIVRPGVAPVRAHSSELGMQQPALQALVSHTVQNNGCSVSFLQMRVDALCLELGLDERDAVIL